MPVNAMREGSDMLSTSNVPRPSGWVHSSSDSGTAYRCTGRVPAVTFCMTWCQHF
jgi:hypothetical protein